MRHSEAENHERILTKKEALTVICLFNKFYSAGDVLLDGIAMFRPTPQQCRRFFLQLAYTNVFISQGLLAELIM